MDGQVRTNSQFTTPDKTENDLGEENSNHMKSETSLNITPGSPPLHWQLLDTSSQVSEEDALPPLSFQSQNYCNEESQPVNDMGGKISCASIQSSYHTSSDACSSSDSDQLQLVHTNGMINTAEYKLPIVGYEIMEERTRFTVFKIQVEHKTSKNNWFVFRRYTDFVRLYRKLKEMFPSIHFSLPPKKWIGDNFSPSFLEERLQGLQNFVKNILAYEEIRNCKVVRLFFCLDEPPGLHDTIEESRAQCENLEEELFRLQQQLKDKDSEIEQLREEVKMLRSQHDTLLNSLRLECALTAYAQSRNPKSSNSKDNTPVKLPSNIHQCTIELQNLTRSLAQMSHKSLLVPNIDINNLTEMNGLHEKVGSLDEAQ